MNPSLRLLVAGLAAASAASVFAQPRVRAGLWDETISIKTDDAQANAAMAQMKERLANLPPDQRAMVEKMMASHGMGSAPGAPDVHRVCISQAMIDHGFTPDRDGRCQHVNVSTAGNVSKFTFACQTAHDNVSGQGTFTTVGDSAFAVSTTADTVSDKKKMHIQTDIAGKFVGSDCGDIKPIELPPAK